ncbi:hypothetical protein [Acinetobacter ursingii]|uniref:hypothetical protein n=1 Tax=Acinetobacter ursingii TaxID=108980 RepID=UPI00124C4A89|nr:hypothetical protein [Acinetobacter ursingii]
MNAHKFVAEFGIEGAKKIIDSAPDRKATHFSFDDCETTYYQKTNNLIYWDDDYDSWCEVYFDMPPIYLLSEIKQVIESVEIVESKGGLRKLKKEANCLFYNGFEGIAESYEKSIADYEAVEACHAKS